MKKKMDNPIIKIKYFNNDCKYTPLRCGYGLYIKNKWHPNKWYSKEIGWTCKHPNADPLARVDRGYYPSCTWMCPLLNADLYNIFNINKNND